MPDLLIDQEGAIATLTFNRPESFNALSSAMRTAITQALHALEMDDSVRCVVMKGAGDHFMAGAPVSPSRGEPQLGSQRAASPLGSALLRAADRQMP